ncbi:MAG: CoA transferase [Reyranella sp.]|nr:CoA transferase [Reyranella sp.]
MLEDIRIVDLTTVVFGPYATQMLVDLGAEVIKVESPNGDQFRHAGQPAATPGMGPCHMTINRGKRSIVLDLKTPEDRQVMRDLIGTADVFIHNVRGQAIERLGFDYASVEALRPDIIYAHCVGFGSDGPYANLQAYDDVIQAATGTATLLSRVGGEAAPRYLPSLIADKVAGLHGAYAVLAALIHRLRTGEGQHVEIPMFEAFTRFMLVEHLYGATFEPPVGGVGYPRQLDADRQPFPTADGYISIVPYTDESIVRVFDILGCPDLVAEERFASPRARLKNMAQVYQAIAALTPARTTADWMEALSVAQIPAMPVRDLADITDDPHLVATGFFRPQRHPSEGDYLAMRAAVRFGVQPAVDSSPAPRLGEHGAEIRAELRAMQTPPGQELDR